MPFYRGFSWSDFPNAFTSHRESIQLPLNGEVLNVDYHADIAPYTQQTTTHTATWQRYAIENGLWDRLNSYNWQPEESTAIPAASFNPNRYITSVSTREVQNLTPEVLSIDLDFFNGLTVSSSEYQNYFSILRGLAKKAKVICIFSSSGWTKDKLTGDEIQTAVAGLVNDFREIKNSPTSQMQK